MNLKRRCKINKIINNTKIIYKYIFKYINIKIYVYILYKMETNLEKIEIKIDEVDEVKNENSVTKEDDTLPKEEVLTPIEDKPKKSFFSTIKNYLFSQNNKEINLKKEDQIVVKDEKISTDEQTDNKITQTLDVLVEEIETRTKKTFVERIFSFILRPCSA